MTASTSTPELTLAAPAPLRLDLGCGTKKREGFTGCDSRAFPGVDAVCNLGAEKWPWADSSVDEVYSCHMLEHLNAQERIHFVNELHRVMKPGTKAQIIVPHWCSSRAYGDLTHAWPPVSEFWPNYLSAKWRSTEAPHNDFYTCDFECVAVVTFNPALMVKSEGYRADAVAWYKEAAHDLVFTLTCKKEAAK